MLTNLDKFFSVTIIKNNNSIDSNNSIGVTNQIFCGNYGSTFCLILLSRI